MLGSQVKVNERGYRKTVDLSEQLPSCALTVNVGTAVLSFHQSGQTVVDLVSETTCNHIPWRGH